MSRMRQLEHESGELMGVTFQDDFVAEVVFFFFRKWEQWDHRKPAQEAIKKKESMFMM